MLHKWLQIRYLRSTIHKAKHKVRYYVLIHNLGRILMPHVRLPQLPDLIFAQKSNIAIRKRSRSIRLELNYNQNYQIFHFFGLLPPGQPIRDPLQNYNIPYKKYSTSKQNPKPSPLEEERWVMLGFTAEAIDGVELEILEAHLEGRSGAVEGEGWGRGRVDGGFPLRSHDLHCRGRRGAGAARTETTSFIRRRGFGGKRLRSDSTGPSRNESTRTGVGFSLHLALMQTLITN